MCKLDYSRGHLKALVFLYAFVESVECALLLSFYDDSNLHISITHLFHDDGCKQGIDQKIFSRKSMSRKITHPQSLFKYPRGVSFYLNGSTSMAWTTEMLHSLMHFYRR